MNSYSIAILKHGLARVGRAQAAIERTVKSGRDAALSRKKAVRDAGYLAQHGRLDEVEHRAESIREKGA